MKRYLSLALTALFFSSATPAAELCKDDPRMYLLGTIIEKIRAGEEVKPLKLTASSYLALTPNAREALGNRIVVLDTECRPVQTVDGLPATRIAIPFEVHMDALRDALAQGDVDRARAVSRYFKSEAKTIDQALPLTRAVFTGTKLENETLQALGVRTSIPKAATVNSNNTRNTLNTVAR